jgi:hypothetical protein
MSTALGQDAAAPCLTSRKKMCVGRRCTRQLVQFVQRDGERTRVVLDMPAKLRDNAGPDIVIDAE